MLSAQVAAPSDATGDGSAQIVPQEATPANFAQGHEPLEPTVSIGVADPSRTGAESVNRSKRLQAIFLYVRYVQARRTRSAYEIARLRLDEKNFIPSIGVHIDRQR